MIPKTKRTRRPPIFLRSEASSCRGLSLIEILAIVAILAVLVALLMPSLKSVHKKAAMMRCVSNLRQISAASATYSNDHNGDWPPSAVGTVFSNYLIPYLGKILGIGENYMNSPLVCPLAKVDAPDTQWMFRGIYTPSTYTDPVTNKPVKYGLSYAQNAYCPGTGGNSNSVLNRLSVHEPSKMMLYMEFFGHYLAAIAGVNNEESWQKLESRHNKNVNVAFADGSVRAITREEVPKTVAEMPNDFWQGRRK